MKVLPNGKKILTRGDIFSFINNKGQTVNNVEVTDCIMTKPYNQPIDFDNAEIYFTPTGMNTMQVKADLAIDSAKCKTKKLKTAASNISYSVNIMGYYPGLSPEYRVDSTNSVTE